MDSHGQVTQVPPTAESDLASQEVTPEGNVNWCHGDASHCGYLMGFDGGNLDTYTGLYLLNISVLN